MIVKKLKLAAISISAFLSLSSCVSTSSQFSEKVAAAKPRGIEVCLTCYHAQSDHWTKQGKTSTGQPLRSWGTCAVDPKIIPYGSIVHIPSLNLKLVAVDTGTAVKNRKASRLRGKPHAPVVDIFIASRSEAKKFATSGPEFATAYIIKNVDKKRD